jgi:hypothetical protein
MRTALASFVLAAFLALGCSRATPPPDPPRPCTAGGSLDPIVFLDGDGGAKAPPGWTTIELRIDNPVACFELVHDYVLREERNDAGTISTELAEDLPALALDHPLVGSKLTVALRGNAWKYEVWWDGDTASLSTNDLIDVPGGAKRLVPPTRRVGMSMAGPPSPEVLR